MHRRMLSLIAAIAALVVPATASAHDPILFVHGWSESGSIWNTDISRFQADGWTAAELNNWTYDTSQSNVTTASQLSTKIGQILAATGATKVDLVTHSMGALNTRYYLKNLSGTAKVDDWVSLGGPNHGTNTANLCSSAACVEMRIGSTFLNNLNATDETPGTVNYGTWWSSCDSVVPSGVPISGATNTQTACLSHTALYSDATVYAQVRNFVQ